MNCSLRVISRCEANETNALLNRRTAIGSALNSFIAMLTRLRGESRCFMGPSLAIRIHKENGSRNVLYIVRESVTSY